MTFNLLFFTIIIKSNKPTLEEAVRRARQNEMREQHVVEYLKYRKQF
ncbi:YrzI family small protein [Bacillus sp. AGMB 02131]|uniref:YrzI family small protein n=1 Tax=Peribacillus faecalis TaxID=2772559 RepID=A0A927CZK4_9BACI|nr:YrzI family small protein [Peribacillus faecalis]MBD3109542.1 YrzI family small protein [Peribacillus faecalis]